MKNYAHLPTRGTLRRMRSVTGVPSEVEATLLFAFGLMLMHDCVSPLADGTVVSIARHLKSMEQARLGARAAPYLLYFTAG